ncbi:hypothetical protein ACS0TY_019888 [Phlomoides rotata]
MTSSCRITSYYDSKGNVKDFLEIRKSVLKVLVSIGMTPSLPKLLLAGPPEVLPVLLDGRVVGSIASEIIEKAVCHLRRFKVSAASVIPEDLEVYMEISCPDGGRKEVFPATHEEIHPTGILSVVGNLTPWSDHNQSPRNMYQCQMAKQTMGFSCQSIHSRADQKLYHLQTPIVRTKT